MNSAIGKWMSTTCCACLARNAVLRSKGFTIAIPLLEVMISLIRKDPQVVVYILYGQALHYSTGSSLITCQARTLFPREVIVMKGNGDTTTLSARSACSFRSEF